MLVTVRNPYTTTGDSLLFFRFFTNLSEDISPFTRNEVINVSNKSLDCYEISTIQYFLILKYKSII